MRNKVLMVEVKWGGEGVKQGIMLMDDEFAD